MAKSNFLKFFVHMPDINQRKTGLQITILD